LTPNNQYNQKINGVQYLVTEVRRALYPTTIGRITLDPAILNVAGSFFNQGLQLQTNVVEINVSALPEGAPEGFKGAVGQYEMHVWIDPETAKVNEPIHLYVRISGKGNSNTLPDPTDGIDFTRDGWRVYDPQITTDMTQVGEELQGEKLISRLLLPTKPGKLTIPALAVVYFDPELDAYQAIESESITIPVAEGDTAAPVIVISDGKQDIQVLGADIRHIKNAPPTLAMAHQDLTTSIWYWSGWVVPMLAVIGTFLWQRHRQTIKSDDRLLRQQRALRTALKQIKQLKENDKEALLYAGAARILTMYLGDKFLVAASGLTRDTIREMCANQVPQDMITRLLTCLDWADEGRFAPAAMGRQASDLVDEIHDLVLKLDNVLDQNRNGQRKSKELIV
ncbi:MAG: BatD family protein, partial [Anaerolineae bacterium]|nr:BatD family protein [Anaerolineae bacterium]